MARKKPAKVKPKMMSKLKPLTAGPDLPWAVLEFEEDDGITSVNIKKGAKFGSIKDVTPKSCCVLENNNWWNATILGKYSKSI
jgi:hypothetical protein